MDKAECQEVHIRLNRRAAGPRDMPRQNWAPLHEAELPTILACLLVHGNVSADQLRALRRVSKAWMAAANAAAKSATVLVPGPALPFLALRQLKLEGRRTVHNLLYTAEHEAAMRLQSQAHLLSTFSGQQLRHLRILQLHNCDSAVFAPLAAAAVSNGLLMPVLQTLGLRCCWLGNSPVWLLRLSALRQLQLVRCYTSSNGCQPNSELWLEHVVQLTGLASLQLVKLDEGAPLRLPKGLAALTQLQDLAFTHNSHRQPVPNVMSLLTCLQRLNLSHCKNMDDLPALPALTCLRLKGCTSVQHRIYNARGYVVKQELPQLSTLVGLRRLDLSHTRECRAPAALTALTALSNLDLSYTANPHFPLEVLRCTALRVLSVSYDADDSSSNNDSNSGSDSDAEDYDWDDFHDILLPPGISALQCVEELKCLPNSVMLCAQVLQLPAIKLIEADYIWGEAAELEQLRNNGVILQGCCLQT